MWCINQDVCTCNCTRKSTGFLLSNSLTSDKGFEAPFSIWPKLHSLALVRFCTTRSPYLGPTERSGGGASTAPPWAHAKHMSFCVPALEILCQIFYRLYSSARAFPQQQHRAETQFKRKAGSSLSLKTTPAPALSSSNETAVGEALSHRN